MDALKTMYMFSKEEEPTQIVVKQNMLEVNMISPGRVTEYDS